MPLAARKEKAKHWTYTDLTTYSAYDVDAAHEPTTEVCKRIEQKRGDKVVTTNSE